MQYIPASLLEITVSLDGSGDYTSIQSAIDAIPPDREYPTTIYIQAGIYNEKLHIEKPYVRLIGDSDQPTVITYNDYARKTFPDGSLYHTFYSYTVFVGSDDFSAEHVTFINTAGAGEQVGQALAVYVDSDRAVFRHCRFIGQQDTLFTGPLPPQPIDRGTFGGPREGAPRRKQRQYYKHCYIEGNVDFIFGSATAVFEQCEIFARKRALLSQGSVNPEGSNSEAIDHPPIHGWLTAASTPEDVKYGYVFIDCQLTSDAPAHSFYLGRPWRNYAKVAFVRCDIGGHIHPEGWHNWNKTEAESSVIYKEYGNQGAGASREQRVSWSSLLDRTEVEEYTVARILAGEDSWLPEAGS